MSKYYKELEIHLKRNGIEYLFGIKPNSYVFLIICLISAIVIGTVSCLIFQCKFVGSCLVLVICFFLPFGVLWISNKSDNDNMLKDIKMIFEMLKIQVHAGVFIVEALETCIEMCNNRRLRKSLQILVNEICMSKDVMKALDDFNDSFSNNHIDTLVIILKQSMETGYSVENLDSAFEQVIDVERAINIKLENSIERNVQVLQVLVMAGIIAIAIYCSIIEFKGIFEMF